LFMGTISIGLVELMSTIMHHVSRECPISVLLTSANVNIGIEEAVSAGSRAPVSPGMAGSPP
jgi:hypothetical protein